MLKKQYLTPESIVLVFSLEGNFCATGEPVSTVDGYDWDEEEEE